MAIKTYSKVSRAKLSDNFKVNEFKCKGEQITTKRTVATFPVLQGK